MQIQPDLQRKLDAIAGLQTAVFQRPSLPGAGGGLPVQFVITSDAPYEEIDAVADTLLGRANQSGRFIFMKKSIELDRPKTTLLIDRDRAGDLGISMGAIGRNLAALLGGNYVNRFSLDGRSYKVIPEASRNLRSSLEVFDDSYLVSATGELVPVSSLVTFAHSVEPSKRTQFQQLNAITLEGVMAPGVALGDALKFLETQAADAFPRGYSFDFTGPSRQFAQQGSALVVTFFLSLLVIYLVLAAQFESWRNPLIILVSVPLSIAGALIFITLGFSTVNIYTQVGLITLIGLIAKNGILIVEFADKLQVEDRLDKRAAVERASAIRLRPILMTTVAMMMAMVPLLTATGPGAVSRFDIGLVVTAGLGIGTLFTLFVVPAFYVLLARERYAGQ
jgi:multidrug efflux pump